MIFRCAFCLPIIIICHMMIFAFISSPPDIDSADPIHAITPAPDFRRHHVSLFAPLMLPFDFRAAFDCSLFCR